MTDLAAAVSKAERRADLDWLRVLAFGLLVPFHVGLGFTGALTYGFTNNESAGPWIGWALLWMHQWRLPLVFVVSGMGSAFALGTRPGGRFAKDRLLRLGVPYLAGIVLLNWAIGAVDARHFDRPAGQTLTEFVLSYWAGLPAALLPGGTPMAGYNQHLWFLAELTAFTFLLLPAFLHLRDHPDGLVRRTTRRVLAWPHGAGLALMALPLAAVLVLVKPFQPGEVGDGYEAPLYLLLFLAGYLVIQERQAFDQAVSRVTWTVPAVAVVSTVAYFSLLLATRHIHPPATTDVLVGGWAGHAPWAIR